MAKKLYAEETPVKKGEAKAVALWQERIMVSKKAQEQWADDSGAKRFVNEYKGKFDIVFHSRHKKVPVPPINDVFSYVQADIAATFNRDPYITVNPKTGSVKAAKIREARLNYWWRELKTKEELEYEIIDKDLIGYAWHKVGMAFQTSGSGETLKIENETLYSRWVDWKDLVWNVGAKRPPVDCQWMAQRIVRPISEIRKKYPGAKGLKGVPCPDIDEDAYKKSSYQDDLQVGVLWEIWDAESKKVYLIAEGLKERFVTEPKPWPEYLDEFPFLMYWDFAVPGSPRPMSAIAPWEPQILEEMILLAQAINHSKRWNRQAFVNKQAFTEDALDKFERGDDGAVIEVNGKVGPEDLRFVDFGQLPTDFYLLMDRIRAIKRDVSGQPEFSRGGVTKTNTRTIGELQLMQQGARGREERRIDRLETHLENIARHMDAHLDGNFDLEQTIRVTGDTPEDVIQAFADQYDPVTRTLKFSAEDIAGEFAYEIKAGSTLPMDKKGKTQVLEVVLQSIANVAAKGPLSPFLVTLVTEILDEYDIKSLEEAWKKDVALRMKAMEEADNKQSVEDDKTAAEAAKRRAQTMEIAANAEIAAQDAEIGPMGRAVAKQLEKPAPEPWEMDPEKEAVAFAAGEE